MTSKEIKKYLTDTYGGVKPQHNCDGMSYACKMISKNHNIDAKQVFHFMVEQVPINSLMTHDYGFNTAGGRQLRQEFEGWYTEYKENNE